MCTLSFIPRREGYAAGMNRDELRSRPRALFPRVYERGQILAAYPSEPEGGTWIAVNGSGVLLALLNWNLNRPGTAMSKQCSRGGMIPELIFEGSFESADTVLEGAASKACCRFALYVLTLSQGTFANGGGMANQS